MSEGSISQEEIDALLSGVDMGALGGGGSFSTVPDIKIDTATLLKFANSMKDKLSNILSSMTQKDASSDGPTVETLGRDQLLAKLPEVVISVLADFSSGLSGDHLFLISTEFATRLVSLINQEENPALDDMSLSVITEIISQFSGSEITELSAGGKLPGLANQPPEAVNQPKAMVRMPQENFALFTYPVTLDGEAFTVWEAVSGQVAEGMAKALGGGLEEVSPSNFTQQPAMGAQNVNSGMDFSSVGMQQPMAGSMNTMGGQMGMQQPMRQQSMMGNMPVMGGQMGMQQTPNVQSLQFPNLQQGVSSSEQGNISLIMDVYMEMTVELGRTKKTIKDILGLGEGTIIELDKLAGEPVDILVNHKPIAKGEVVVIDENFGVRVTEILPAIEHVASSV